MMNKERACESIKGLMAIHLKFAVTAICWSPLLVGAAEPQAGSIASAKELTRQFLSMVADAGSQKFEITSVIPRDGKVTVNAGIPIGTQRNSCSVMMIKHPTANKTGWVVQQYACGLITPGTTSK